MFSFSQYVLEMNQVVVLLSLSPKKSSSTFVTAWSSALVDLSPGFSKYSIARSLICHNAFFGSIQCARSELMRFQAFSVVQQGLPFHNCQLLLEQKSWKRQNPQWDTSCILQMNIHVTDIRICKNDDNNRTIKALPCQVEEWAEWIEYLKCSTPCA